MKKYLPLLVAALFLSSPLVRADDAHKTPTDDKKEHKDDGKKHEGEHKDEHPKK